MDGYDRTSVERQRTRGRQRSSSARRAEIVTRYNQLVTDFNNLRRHAIEAAREADRRGSAIAELQHEAEALRREKDSLEAECVRLRQESNEKGIEITFLRHILRQEHPDRYPPE